MIRSFPAPGGGRDGRTSSGANVAVSRTTEGAQEWARAESGWEVLGDGPLRAGVLLGRGGEAFRVHRPRGLCGEHPRVQVILGWRERSGRRFLGGGWCGAAGCCGFMVPAGLRCRGWAVGGDWCFGTSMVGRRRWGRFLGCWPVRRAVGKIASVPAVSGISCAPCVVCVAVLTFNQAVGWVY